MFSALKKYFVQPYRKANLKWRMVLCGNSLSLKLNLRWFIHHLYCRLLSKLHISNADSLAIAQNLSRNGYAYIGNSNVNDLASYLERAFDQYHIGTESRLPRKRDEFVASKIFNILEEHYEKIYSYYQSHFQTHWISLSKYSPAPREDMASSFGWHIDDNPKPLMKVFVYFNDTYEANAAFRAFNYQTTKNIFKRGFISSSEESRRNSQSLVTTEDMSHLKIFEGLKGTVLIFDNNLIHKATTPRDGYRIVAQIEIYPSKTKLTYENILHSLDGEILRDYPADPFKNPYLKSTRK